MASGDNFFDDSFVQGDDWETIFEREDAIIKRKYEETGKFLFLLIPLCCSS